MESSRPLQDRPGVCVVAQQYSSATFVSLPFHSRKINRCGFLNVIIVTSFAFITNALGLKLGLYRVRRGVSVLHSTTHISPLPYTKTRKRMEGVP